MDGTEWQHGGEIKKKEKEKKGKGMKKKNWRAFPGRKGRGGDAQIREVDVSG